MPTYPEWRDTAELVVETQGSNMGAVHVRIVDTGRVLCGLPSAFVDICSELPAHRTDLPWMHIGCHGRLPL
jgi:hypothetical protein